MIKTLQSLVAWSDKTVHDEIKIKKDLLINKRGIKYTKIRCNVKHANEKINLFADDWRILVWVHELIKNVEIKQRKHKGVLKVHLALTCLRKEGVVGSDEQLLLNNTQWYLEASRRGWMGRRIRRSSWWTSSWWVTNARRPAADVCSGAWSRVLAGASWTPTQPGQGTRRQWALCGWLGTFLPVSVSKFVRVIIKQWLDLRTH